MTEKKERRDRTKGGYEPRKLGPQRLDVIRQMAQLYPTVFKDKLGTENTFIENDGETLRMTLRGVTFEDSEFDSFEPIEGTDQDSLTKFSLNKGMLCDCSIECEIPVPIVNQGTEIQGVLRCEIKLGSPKNKGGLECEDVTLQLAYGNNSVSSSGTSGWLEDELIEIQKQLPNGDFMKTCMNCLFSDYSPYGHGMFGNMMCFKNLKKEYLQVTSKEDFWEIHDRPDRFVQETFLCTEFEKRVPGTGYRG